MTLWKERTYGRSYRCPGGTVTGEVVRSARSIGVIPSYCVKISIGSCVRLHPELYVPWCVVFASSCLISRILLSFINIVLSPRIHISRCGDQTSEEPWVLRWRVRRLLTERSNHWRGAGNLHAAGYYSDAEECALFTSTIPIGPSDGIRYLPNWGCGRCHCRLNHGSEIEKNYRGWDLSNIVA